MDIDMHYYGTYALARAAGVEKSVAHRIATAAEFVDDSTTTVVMPNPQGARFRGEPTAHHPQDLAPNYDQDDQLLVWLPFHFLPGAEGKTQSQRLICRKNSKLAQEMVEHHLQLAMSWYAPELIGITAHVYADTFAHYGFSGVSSRVNRVLGDKIVLKNGDPLEGALGRFVGKFGVQGGMLRNFRDAVMSGAAELVTGALGHGAVAIFPDQPYLEWSYTYEMPVEAGATTVNRVNHLDYMEGAEALYTMFRRFAGSSEDYADPKGPRDFAEIEPTVRALINLVKDRDGRITAWLEAIKDGKLSREANEELPAYDHNAWRTETNKLAALPNPEDATGLPWYHFHQAAAMHRNFVLRELLPRHGIVVI